MIESAFYSYDSLVFFETVHTCLHLRNICAKNQSSLFLPVKEYITGFPI